MAPLVARAPKAGQVKSELFTHMEFYLAVVIKWTRPRHGRLANTYGLPLTNYCTSVLEYRWQ